LGPEKKAVKQAGEKGREPNKGDKSAKESTPPIMVKAHDPAFLAMISCSFCPEPRIFTGQPELCKC